MRTDTERTGGQPDCGDAASGDFTLVIHLACKKQAARAAELLVIGESGRGGRRQVGGGARAASAVCEIEPGARTRDLSINGGVRSDRGAVFGPLQYRASHGSGTQHPLPVVAFDAGGGRLAAELIEGSEHRLELDAHDGGQMRADAHVLLNGGKKAGERYADGVQTGSEALAVKNSLCVGEEAKRSGLNGGFGDNLHRRAHLRRAGGITHNSRKLASGGVFLRGRRGFSHPGARQGQDEGPPGSGGFLFNVQYLPGPALAALFVSNGGFTVKSALLDTLLFQTHSVPTTHQ